MISLTSMIRIFFCLIPCCRYVTAVFSILYGSAFHIANDTANVVFTFNIQTVINKISAIANGRIYGMAN